MGLRFAIAVGEEPPSLVNSLKRNAKVLIDTFVQ